SPPTTAGTTRTTPAPSVSTSRWRIPSCPRRWRLSATPATSRRGTASAMESPRVSPPSWRTMLSGFWIRPRISTTRSSTSCARRSRSTQPGPTGTAESFCRSEMAISTTILTSRIVGELKADGVSEVEAKRAAEQFVDTLKRDHPDWFEKPKIKLEDFVEARARTIAQDKYAVHTKLDRDWAQEMLNILSNYWYLSSVIRSQEDNVALSHPIASYRGQRQSYGDVIRRYAQIF